MDQIETWTVRGRVATAVKRVREDLACLAADSEELAEAVAEAEQHGLYDDQLAAIGSEAVL